MGLLGNGFDDPQSAAIMALAGGLLQGNFGGGLLGANQAFAQAKRAAFENEANQLQLKKGRLEVDELQRKVDEDRKAAEVLRGFYGSNGLLGGGGAKPPVTGGPTNLVNDALPPDLQIGALAPTPSYQAAAATGGVQPKAAIWQQYQTMGQQLAQAGLGKQAQAYFEMAEKHRPKFSQTPQVVRDPISNRLVNVLIGDDGSTNVLPYGVKPEISIEDFGGTKRAIDKTQLTGNESFDVFDPNKPFNMQGGKPVANTAYQKYELVKAATGAPKMPAINLHDPTAVAQAAVKFQGDVRGALKDEHAIAGSFKAMQEAVKNPSAQGDTALLYSFFKALDPTSTVREGEIDMVKASRSIPDRFKGYAQKLANGQTLMPNEREDILTQAQRQLQSRLPRVQNDVKAFRDNASRLGLDPELYVPDPYKGVTLGAPAAAPSGNPLMDAARAELERRRGGR